MKTERVKTIAAIGLIALLVNTAYIAAFASPTIFYMANVLGHVVLGILVAIVGALALARHRELRSSIGPAAVLFALALAIGLYLTVHGNLADDRPVLRLHVVAGALAVAALAPFAWRAFAAGGSSRAWALGGSAAAMLAVALPVTA